jgi:hypothetical protein
VLWRNFDSVWLAGGAERRYLWVHDPLALASDQEYFTPEFLGALSGIFVKATPNAASFLCIQVIYVTNMHVCVYICD